MDAPTAGAVVTRELRPTPLPHAFDAAADEPADWFGRRACSACGKPGTVGDVQHPHGALPMGTPPPSPPGAAELDSRILGERPDDRGDSDPGSNVIPFRRRSA